VGCDEAFVTRDQWISITSTAEEAAEKVEKQIPRGLTAARNDKNKKLVRHD
jgi:hypothetical protein